MDIRISNVPRTADVPKVVLALRTRLHGPLFNPYQPNADEKLNFKVFLKPRCEDGPLARYHDTTGTLTLPSEEAGITFLKHFGFPIRFRIAVDGEYLVFKRSEYPPVNDVVEQLKIQPWRHPQAIQELERRRDALSGKIKLKDVQFVWMCREESISIEWHWNRCSSNIGGSTPRVTMGSFDCRLVFNDEREEILLTKLNQQKDSIIIALRYSIIRAIETNPFDSSILFMLKAAPSYEGPQVNGARRRLTYIDDEHKPLAPFLWSTLRLVCNQPTGLEKFADMARTACLPLQGQTSRPGRPIVWRGLFHVNVLREMNEWLISLKWPIAFQCESLLSELLLDTTELLSLRRDIEELAQSRGTVYVCEVLRRLGLILREVLDWKTKETVQTCFESAQKAIESDEILSRSPFFPQSARFQCFHVTITPTRRLFEGPFPDISNRILRQYSAYYNSFLRVSFADEEYPKFHDSYGWRKIDTIGFIKTHVGDTLKSGLELCGRKFEFLAYTLSALKDYTVWYISPFKDSEGNEINAQFIRTSICTEWPTDVLKRPAKLAARLSQAFTATVFSFPVAPGEIRTIKDIKRNRYDFSDGNGSLSLEMATEIHCCRSRHDTASGRPAQNIVPSVFQVRIQGAKGTISIDPTIDGSEIRLRPSMVKFPSKHTHEIEIVKAFNKPGDLFLNRILIVLLEGLGVDPEVFLSLQRNAVEKTTASAESFESAAGLLENHSLGFSFTLSSTFRDLHRLGIVLGQEESVTNHANTKDTFMQRCMRFALYHIFRDIKHRARVSVPESWKLVGVIDVHNILKPNQIYACITKGNGTIREYINGTILISKPPTIHPGDVQLVEAIGEPPADSPLHALYNCVVFSQRGSRPLPNQLSGSDLDGDEYNLIGFKPLHPPKTMKPGRYFEKHELVLKRESSIKDIANFVVDFIINDKLGKIANTFLRIADREGIFVPECAKLAELHSWAVDFQKNGKPVPHYEIPRPKLRLKPDWYAPEIIDPSQDVNYYKSGKVLGRMFREIELPGLPDVVYANSSCERSRRLKQESSSEDIFEKLCITSASLDDPISTELRHRWTAISDLNLTKEVAANIQGIFNQFTAELEHISIMHTPSYSYNNGKLTEEEILIGTIIAKAHHYRKRSSITFGLRESSNMLVQDTWRGFRGNDDSPIKEWILRSWTAWTISKVNERLFGAKTFGLVALRAMLDALTESSI